MHQGEPKSLLTYPGNNCGETAEEDLQYSGAVEMKGRLLKLLQKAKRDNPNRKLRFVRTPQSNSSHLPTQLEVCTVLSENVINQNVQGAPDGSEGKRPRLQVYSFTSIKCYKCKQAQTYVNKYHVV